MLSLAKKNDKTGILALLEKDARFGEVKLFIDCIITPIAISENGYIGLYQAAERKQVKSNPLMGSLIPKFEDIPEELIVIDVKQINGIELIVDKKSGLGGAIAGGLLFGGGGAVVGQAISGNKAKSIDLQIKTADFKRPQIVVPLYLSEGNVMMNWDKMIKNAATGKTMKNYEQEIQELMSLLDNVVLAANQKANTVVHQASNADELAKFKKLLDDGIINQDEFDIKKKQLLGI